MGLLMLITEIMSRPLITVSLDDSLAEVLEVFEQARIRFIAVVEQNKLFGVIDKADVLKAVSPYVFSHIHTTRDLATLQRRVHEIVKRKPVFLRQQATVEQAIASFNTHNIGCLPVCDDDDVPVGMVTRSDVLRHFERICQARQQEARS